MPEGPELKITCNFLKSRLLNEKITLIIKKGRYTRHTLKNLDKVKFPLKVKDINVKGKFIYFSFFDTPITMWVTLGMSGHFIEQNDNSSPYLTEKHNNIAIKYGENKVIWYQDYRNFGTFMFALTEQELQKKLSKIGLDLLEPDTSFEEFNSILKEKRSNIRIAEALLEQKYISGIGNYCRSEALYLSKINPFVLVKDLSIQEMKQLFHWIRVVLYYHYDLELGIKNKIIQNKDLKLFPIKEGSTGKKYSFFFVVYSQKTDPLGNKVTKTKDKNGRTIHWVSEIQKKH